MVGLSHRPSHFIPPGAFDELGATSNGLGAPDMSEQTQAQRPELPNLQADKLDLTNG